jgi:hypothetical protein
MSTVKLSPQDDASTTGTPDPAPQAPQAGTLPPPRTPASDTLAERLTRHGDRPFRDEDAIVRGAGNFINDLAMLAATTDASVLKDLWDLRDLIERRASEAAMILTRDTEEAREQRGGLDRIPWSAVAVEFPGWTPQRAYETFTPGVRDRKSAQGKARRAAK